ncbi:hypothetical protein GCM10027056_31500 [Glaciibacter psychrotolerans]
MIGSHDGVYATGMQPGTVSLLGDVSFDAMGMTAQGETVFVSGHPGADNNDAFAAPHIGFVRHTPDTGWEAVSLAGSTDFHILQTSSADPNLVIGVPSDKPVLMRSTDAGSTWIEASPLNARDLSIDSQDPTLLTATTAEGVLVSHDAGTTFELLAGAPQLVLIAADPTRTGGLVGIDQQGALWAGSAEADESWTTTGTVTGAAAALTVNSTGVIAVADDSGVATSADGGKSWTVLVPAS